VSTAGRNIDFGPIEFRDNLSGSQARELRDNCSDVAIAIRR
jgi:hypothetical protein